MAVEIIKFDGNFDTFAWKYPNSNLGTWCQLIVNESQEAVLFKGGKALDVLSSGRHTLETNNIPVLGKLVNLPFGKKSPFSAEIWFVNKAHALDVKWGTPTPIQLQDPKYGIIVPVRSFGQFGIQIEDAKKFLVKLVGTVPFFDKVNLVNFFRGLFLTKVKDSLSSYLINKKISILEVNAYIDEISESLKARIAPTLDEYGIKLVSFYVNDISTPDNDPAVAKLRDALAKRAEMDIIGYNYQQERSFDTLEGAAKNNASGGIMGAGMGLGMGVGMGAGMGSQFGNMVGQIDTSQKHQCPSCRASINQNAVFCPTCGFDTRAKGADKQEKIKCDKCGASFSRGAKFCPECGDKYQPCPKCGADLLPNATACSACGYELPLPCPKCGYNVKKNAKFCPDCGTSLVKKCPTCNIEIKDDAKFCPDCGAKIEG